MSESYTDFPAYSDTVGTREKCHCNRVSLKASLASHSPEYFGCAAQGRRQVLEQGRLDLLQRTSILHLSNFEIVTDTQKFTLSNKLECSFTLLLLHTLQFIRQQSVISSAKWREREKEDFDLIPLVLWRSFHRSEASAQCIKNNFPRGTLILSWKWLKKCHSNRVLTRLEWHFY